MAFYNNEDEKKLDPVAQNGVQTSAENGTIASQGDNGSGSAAASAPKGDSPGNFVGLNQYLEANKTQGAKLGDNVAGQVSNKVQDAQSDIGGVGQKFNALANKGTINNLGQAIPDAQNVVQKAATKGATEENRLDDSDRNRFGEIANAQYKGPNNLIETDLYAPIQAKIGQALNYANLSKDESGQKQLLKTIYDKPGYSAGENRLDSYLLNSNENRNKLSNARSGADTLSTQFTTAGDEASKYAKNLTDQTAAARDAARTGLQTQQSASVQKVDSDLANQNAHWMDEYNQYKGLLDNSQGGSNLALNDTQAARLGVTPDERIYNLLSGANEGKGSQYLSQQAFDPNRVISKDQQAQLAALDSLANTYGGELKNKFTNAAQAGTLNAKDAFSGSKFGDSARAAEGLFNNAAKNETRSDTVHGDLVDASGNQSIADYLSGKGLDINHSGEMYNLVDTSDIDQTLKNNISDQIKKYLQSAGYNNQVKKA